MAASQERHVMWADDNGETIPELQELFNRTGGLDIGQLQFINLGAVKRRTGERWERFQEKIFQTGQFFIEKRTNPEDLIIRCRDGFIIVFAELTASAAKKKCASISKEMNTFFLGREELREVQITISHDTIDASQLRKLAEASGVQSIAERSNNEEHAAPSGDASPAPWERIVYRPVWDARSEALVSNKCCAQSAPGNDGERQEGVLLLPEDSRKSLSVRLNNDLTGDGLAPFRTDAFKSGPFSLTLPLQFLSLEDPWHRSQIVSRISEIPSELRQYLLIMFEGLKAGVPVSHLYETVHVFRPYVKMITLSASGPGFPWERYGECEADGFCVDVRTLPASGSARKRDFEHLLTAARRGKAHALATGVERADDFFLLAQSGYRYLSGEAIAPVSDLPAAPSHLTAESIHARLRGSG